MGVLVFFVAVGELIFVHDADRRGHGLRLSIGRRANGHNGERASEGKGGEQGQSAQTRGHKMR